MNLMKPLKDRFVDRALVSRGSFSTSCRARDVALGRIVFLKALRSDLSTDGDTRSRFQREARAAARLDHPNLARLFEFGEDVQEGMYMALEWVEGSSLASQLSRSGPCPPDQVSRLARDLLLGLTELHQAGIVHRDLKPENILITGDGQAKITDFSLANLNDEPRLTHHCAIVGTPAYMAPEQVAGKSPADCSDLFSTGIILLEAATGTNPFTARDMVQTMQRVRQLEPQFDSALFIALRLDLQTLIRSCLQKSPNARPANAAAALALIGQEITSGVRASPPRRRFAVATLAVALTLVTFVLLILLKKPTPVSKSLPAKDTVRQDLALQQADPIPVSQNLDLREQIGISGAKETSITIPDPKTTSMPQIVTNELRRDSVATLPVLTQAPESVGIVLDVIPWAYVYLHGTKIGTSPFRFLVRLPAGMQWLSFENTEMPRVDLPLVLERNEQVIQVDLPEHLLTVEVAATPRGFVFVDGEAKGATTLVKPLFLLPGKHVIRVTHPELKELERSLEGAGGDTLRVTADLDRSAWDMSRSGRATN
jgi:serine/threonine-protein kinase